MKFFICALALVAAASAAPQAYNPAGYAPQVITKDGRAAILKYDQDQNENGEYKWQFETENGISAGETNVPQSAGPNGELAPNVEGGYQYTAPDGQVVQMKYSAGVQGFLVTGSHLPVAPEIPEEILKSLAWNAAHPEEEQLWDPANYKQQVVQPIYPGRK